MNNASSKSWIYDIVIITLIITVLFGIFLGSFPLKPPDGARYSEIPREMVTRHNYITPYLNGIKYLEKPPMFYWMQTASIKLFGLSEWSMRFMNAFMGLLGCIFVYIAGRKLYNRRAGFLASLILATSGIYFFMSHFITLDITFTGFITGALLCFIIGTRSPPSKSRNSWMWLMYVFAALAVMTKGLVGIIFPGMIIFFWVLTLNKWRDLKTYCIPTGIILFLIIATPWHILAQMQTPAFFKFYFLDQQFLRYLTSYAVRVQPIYFLPVVLLLGSLPWVVFLPSAIKNNFPKKWSERHKYEPAIFLLLWPLLIFIFYWCSKSQLIPYILPVLPPLAILIGYYLATHWRPKLFWSIFIITGVILIGGYCTYSKIINRFSVKPLVTKLQPLLQPGDEVVSYNTYYQDLTFYLRQKVTIVGWTNELTFGMAQQPESAAWIINYNTFWDRWNSNKKIFVIMDKDNYKHLSQYTKNLYKIAAYGDQVLATNQSHSSKAIK